MIDMPHNHLSEEVATQEVERIMDRPHISRETRLQLSFVLARMKLYGMDEDTNNRIDAARLEDDTVAAQLSEQCARLSRENCLTEEERQKMRCLSDLIDIGEPPSDVMDQITAMIRVFEQRQYEQSLDFDRFVRQCAPRYNDTPGGTGLYKSW